MGTARKYRPELIVTVLWQMEVGIAELTYYRWRRM